MIDGQAVTPIVETPKDSMTTAPMLQGNGMIPEFAPNDFRMQAERMSAENQTVTENTMREDPYALEAARNVVKFRDPDNFPFMNDEVVMSTMLDYIGQVNYNIPAAIAATMEYDKADADVLASMSYLMETYDQKETSWAGMGRLTLGLATDPSTYFSIATLGVGSLGQAAAKMTASQVLKKYLMNKGTLMAIEGATYTGVGDALAQELREDVGLQEDYDPIQGIASTALGAVAPSILSKVGKGITKGLGKLYTEGEKSALVKQ